MKDFEMPVKSFTRDEINALIRRFGDPHEQQHSMGERIKISDALRFLIAELKRKDKGGE